MRLKWPSIRTRHAQWPSSVSTYVSRTRRSSHVPRERTARTVGGRRLWTCAAAVCRPSTCNARPMYRCTMGVVTRLNSAPFSEPTNTRSISPSVRSTRRISCAACADRSSDGRHKCCRDSRPMQKEEEAARTCRRRPTRWEDVPCVPRPARASGLPARHRRIGPVRRSCGESQQGVTGAAADVRNRLAGRRQPDAVQNAGGRRAPTGLKIPRRVVRRRQIRVAADNRIGCGGHRVSLPIGAAADPFFPARILRTPATEVNRSSLMSSSEIECPVSVSRNFTSSTRPNESRMPSSNRLASSPMGPTGRFGMSGRQELKNLLLALAGLPTRAACRGS